MTVTASKPALNLRDLLARIVGIERRLKRGMPLLPPVLFTGDASTTAFALPKGAKPYAVFNNGSLAVEGSGDDYTVSFDGFVYTVTFAVAPGSGNSIAIWPQEA